RYRFALCALSVAAMAASLTYFQPRRTQAQQTPTILRGAAALDQLKQDGQYESLQAAMNQARFSVSRAENTPLGRAAWRAPNPKAGYDAYVTEAGVSIAVNDQSYVSLSLHSFGYGHAMQGVAPGKVSGDKQTINVMREGGVREWFVNGPDGLEHGFTLSEPPGARHQGVPLRLALQVSKGWRAVASEDGKAVTLRGADTAVEYSKLVVNDSQGRNIPARLTVADDQVVIEVEDHDAAYPLTIDPIFTLQQKLMAADGTANERFGEAVALSGDTVVVGVPFDNIGWNQSQGSAYIFTRSGGTWTQSQYSPPTTARRVIFSALRSQ
ncbi:MAG: FG-GAP repeat protein, partial [Blastocatellia bacterium]